MHKKVGYSSEKFTYPADEHAKVQYVVYRNQFVHYIWYASSKSVVMKNCKLRKTAEIRHYFEVFKMLPWHTNKILTIAVTFLHIKLSVSGV